MSSSASAGDSLSPGAPTASARIATAAGIIMLGAAISRLLGIVRVQVIAVLFGTTVATSAFATAATVPTMVYDLLIGGAISAALIPIFGEYVGSSDRAELARLASSIWTAVLVVVGAAVVVLAVFAPQLVWVLGVTSPEVQSEAVSLVRIVLPSVLFLGLAGVTTALLYARQEFAYPAFAVGLYNVGIIAAGLLLAPMLGTTALAVGVLVGAFLQLAFQIRGLCHLPFRLTLDFRHPALGRILKLYAPVAVGLVISQIGILIDRNLAWRTGEDSVAIMSFATTLVQFPLGLIATATSFAILPALSRDAVHDPSSEPERLLSYKRTLSLGIRLVLLLIIPATVGLVLLRTPLIQVLFQHGVFDARSTELTSTAFLFYAPQLPFAAIDLLLIFAFYARRDTLTPALVGLLGVGIYLTAGLLLIGPVGLGLWGLIIANTLQNSLHALVLLALLYRGIGSLRGLGIGPALLKALVATGAMGIVCFAIARYLPTGGGLLGALAVVVVGAAVAGTVYVGMLAMLRTSEMGYAVEQVRARFHLTPWPPSPAGNGEGG